MGVKRVGNLASQPTRPFRIVTAVVWLIGLALCLGLIWSIWQTRELWEQTDQLEAHKSRLIEETNALAELAVSAPTTQQLSVVGEKIERFNLLTGPRAIPLSRILRHLEENLPADVRVSQLAYDAETGQLSVGLQALEEADLPPALRVLEEAAMLTNVILERQLRVQQGTQTVVQYDIRAVAI